MFHPRQLSEPIVQAPMAGGPSTPELAIAVSEAGGLGFLAAGYKPAESVREDIAAVRAGTRRPFGVNIFVPSREPADPGVVNRYAAELVPEAERLGVPLAEPRFDDDDWAGKLDLVCTEQVAVVSFAFGCPDAEVFERLHREGIAVWVTVTRVAEAAHAHEAGADALIVQGTEAGGHRGGFEDDEHAGGTGLVALLRLIRQSVPSPLIATGAVADGPAQIGTALMLAPEAGTTPAQRALLQEPIPTQLTRAFSGRLARGMVNRFQAAHSESAPVAYPEIHHLTSPLRASARRRGDAGGFNLWAGQAHELTQERPAAEVVRRLSSDARQTLRALAQNIGG
jgi:nitronate monooxygenase